MIARQGQSGQNVSMSINIKDKVVKLAKRLEERSWTISTAESCTGGLIASTLTDLSGSSNWFTGGVVAYSNPVKAGVLKVPQKILDTVGAVSQETVEAMAKGVCALLKTDGAVAVSGVAGPTGGSPEKPVGTVWIAWVMNGKVDSHCFHFDGGRLAVKEQTMVAAIDGLLERTKD